MAAVGANYIIGGSGFGNNFGPYGKPAPPPPTSVFGNPATFTAAANTQGSDYDQIMQGYKDLVSRIQQTPIIAQPVTTQNVAPTTAPYSQSSDVSGSLANLSDLATTGGLSDADIQNIRERDISPIRAIYADTQQNIERAKALGGGYSPNYNATAAELSRQEANQIADTTTAANAGIAQEVQQGKLAAAPQYASAAEAANNAATQAAQFNASVVNATNEANAARQLQAGTTTANNALAAAFGNRANLFTGLGGQTSLYGTTPALTTTFGNQVVQAGQLGQGQQSLDQNNQRNLYSFLGSLA